MKRWFCEDYDRDWETELNRFAPDKCEDTKIEVQSVSELLCWESAMKATRWDGLKPPNLTMSTDCASMQVHVLEEQGGRCR